MSDKCDVVLKCIGDEKSIERLYKAVLSCLNDDCYGTTLYNIAEKLGFHTSCIGEVTGVNFEDGYLIIDYTADYCEQSEFRKALESELPGMRIMFSEIVFDRNVFRTNDSGFYHFYRYALFDDDFTIFKRFDFLFEVALYLIDDYGDPNIKKAVNEIMMDDSLYDDKGDFDRLVEAIGNDKRLHLVEMEVVD